MINCCRILALLLSWSVFVPSVLNAQPAAQPSTFNPQPAFTNRVLELGGNGNYLELPAELFQDLAEATLECRVKWHSFTGNQHVFEFDAEKRV